MKKLVFLICSTVSLAANALPWVSYNCTSEARFINQSNGQIQSDDVKNVVVGFVDMANTGMVEIKHSYNGAPVYLAVQTGIASNTLFGDTEFSSANYFLLTSPLVSDFTILQESGVETPKAELPRAFSIPMSNERIIYGTTAVFKLTCIKRL